MVQRKFLLCVYLILVCMSFTTYAQRNMGVATSEWSNMNNLYLNPANIAGSHEKITIGLISAAISIDNSLGTFTRIGNISSALSTDSGSNNTLFKNAGKQSFSMLLPAAEIRGPGILIKLNDKQSIALTTRIRVMNQFNNFDQSLYSTITNPGSIPGNDKIVTAQNFNWTAHLWSEMGLTYARVLMDRGGVQIKAGATIRYLGGAAYLALKGNNLDLDYAAGKDSFYASHSDLQYTSNVVSAKSAVFNGISAGNLFGNLFGSKAGSGIGGDAGLICLVHGGSKNGYSEKDPKYDYKLKLSFSITDIGHITYKQADNSTVNVTGNGYITGKGLSDNVKNYTTFKNYMIQQGFNGDTGSAKTTMHLPTAFLMGVDYQLYGHVYINATYISNLANRTNFGNSFYDAAIITPRFDSKLLTVGVPITYSMLAGDVKMGLGIRFGGFFIGSDDMLALFSSNQYGFGFYFGGYVPLYKKASKDS